MLPVPSCDISSDLLDAIKKLQEGKIDVGKLISFFVKPEVKCNTCFQVHPAVKVCIEVGANVGDWYTTTWVSEALDEVVKSHIGEYDNKTCSATDWFKDWDENGIRKYVPRNYWDCVSIMDCTAAHNLNPSMLDRWVGIPNLLNKYLGRAVELKAKFCFGLPGPLGTLVEKLLLKITGIKLEDGKLCLAEAALKFMPYAVSLPGMHVGAICK